MRTVKDILNTKIQSYKCVRSDALMLAASKILSSANSSYLTVTEDGVFKGILCERYYAEKFYYVAVQAATLL
ncbi:MAG: hypothetical protein C4308_12540 [Chitinophagaceae bacterium]